jgi:hypothetical protein
MHELSSVRLTRSHSQDSLGDQRSQPIGQSVRRDSCDRLKQFGKRKRTAQDLRWQALDAFRDDHAVLPFPNRAPTKGDADQLRPSENRLPVRNEIPHAVL